MAELQKAAAASFIIIVGVQRDINHYISSFKVNVMLSVSPEAITRAHCHIIDGKTNADFERKTSDVDFV